MLRRDTDFQQVFTLLGRSVAQEEPVLDTLDAVWTQVFGPQSLTVSQPARGEGTLPAPLMTRPELPPPAREEDPVTAAVREELGLTGSVTPVLGVLTSGFGPREHPIDGGTKMHDGVDLAADEGSDILAFADGTVDYIGESPAYGLYLQLRHENDVCTFYAHCSKLCVQKGERVTAGQRVAQVGSTGNTTGAHLHFEVKKDGERVDPLAYIDRLG